MAIKKANTATLIRGATYTLRHPDHKPQAPKDSLRFERGVPVVIEDPRILNILQNMMEEIEDGEGEVYEKPVFRVDRGVDAPDETNKGPKRLSATRVVKRRLPK